MNNIKYSIYFNNTSKQFTERGFEAILCIVLTIGILFLIQLFPVMGIAIAVFVYSFLCVGTKRYLLSIVRNEFIPIESIFYTFKICIKTFCLKVAVWLITLLWSLIFIIPGIITALNYSLCSFVMADNNDVSVLESMLKSKRLVSGHRSEIFIVYLAYFFVIVVEMCLFAAIGIAMKTYTNVNMWVPIISMTIAFLFVLFVFIVPYFELMFANIYIILKKEMALETKKDEQKQTVKRTTTRKTTSKSKSE